jgi:hypothetical protein
VRPWSAKTASLSLSLAYAKKRCANFDPGAAFFLCGATRELRARGPLLTGGLLNSGSVELARRVSAIAVARDVVAVVDRLGPVSDQVHPNRPRDARPVQVPHGGAPQVVQTAPWQAGCATRQPPGPIKRPDRLRHLLTAAPFCHHPDKDQWLDVPGLDELFVFAVLRSQESRSAV